ncbi:MAG: RHS repeat-associated core domain-containing protein [Xanthomonadaceae bacterium]|nr:RHS repeat-associated core domain-containing protein [Xanthomonadaceae bacterium]
MLSPPSHARAVAAWLIATLAIVLPNAAAAQDSELSDEYARYINAAQTVGTLGTDLFGDQTDLYTGVTTFSAVDVSLPGNSGLPVQVGRTRTLAERNIQDEIGLFANWELDIPHLHGVFGAGNGGGWKISDPTRPDQRCSVSNISDAEPPVVEGSLSTLFAASEYWAGNHLYVPGQGDQEMLLLGPGSTVTLPSDGTSYYWVTASQWMFSCLATTANGQPGEGFRARSPDGVVYFFDHLAKRNFNAIIKPKNSFGFLVAPTNPSPTATTTTTTDPSPTALNDGSVLARQAIWLLPTRIEDRHGNWVSYSYDSAQPWQLTDITANDGRHLTLTYTADGRIASVSDGSRTWAYTYVGTGNTASLSAAQRPDGSSWSFSLPGGSINYDTGSAKCENSGSMDAGANSFTGSITHPSGAVGTFTISRQRHGRSYVQQSCAYMGPALTSPVAFSPQTFDVLALTSKQISGPGLSPTTWSFDYGPANGSWAEDCPTPSSCPRTRTVSATGPGEFTRYTFGNKWREDEGKLLRVERGASATAIVQTEDTTYQLDPAGQPYPALIGYNPNIRSDNTSAIPKPFKQRVIGQQGTTFTRLVNSFDNFANPLNATLSSSLGYSATESTTYHHNPIKWVLGQVATVTRAGKVSLEVAYDGNAMPISRRSFGLLQQTMSYNLDGTVNQVGDGNGNKTTLSGWMSGIPQSIRFADASTRSAVVDGLGQITSTTDELNTTTSYTYDVMGRLASLSIPGWTPSSFSFVQESVNAEFGIPKNHWRHTETTGTYKKTTYFDGRFRPLLTLEEDTANAASKRYSTRAFDHDNRETFASYPEASATTVTSLSQGTSTSYDALGRVTSTAQNSELGTLSTSTAYLAGFQTRTTNPNGQSTTVSYQAYDSPDTSAPVSIIGPDNVTTTIARDVFGMPTSVIRSGLYSGLPVSATRSYVYDGFERLCKRVDPEAGGTLFEYDDVGNLIGSAEGQSSSLGCNAIPAAARISRSYDVRNRLLSVAAPNAPATIYTYAADGALVKLDQGFTTWFYGYNNRRLLTSELLTLGDEPTPYDFNYIYNALGHLDSSSTPSGLTIDYAPNALGQPSKAGSFASNAKYFPDGSLQSFSYGNGVAHTVTQNGRHLPLRVRDVGAQVAQDFNYTYDPNGNVLGIADNEPGNLQSRTLGYDVRDRLTSASGVWGNAGYTYDPLDNLRSADQEARQFRYQYDGNNRLTQLTDPAGTPLPGLDFAYDAQGRQVRKGSQTRTFDGANRITAINGETYAYDGNGRRIATWAADGRTKVEVYTQNGQLGFAVDSAKGGGSSFVYLAGQRIAEDHWDCGTDTHKVTYIHSDALGSPVATTDATGNVLERTYYAPYGEALNRTVDGPGYTGHVMDAATGLVYAQQRYYDPVVGKFLNIDPVAADAGSGGNFNRYWYANDNPYKFTDPDGRFVLNVGAAALGAVVGGVVGGVVAVAGGGGVKGAIAGFVGGAVGGAITGATLGAGSTAGAIAAAGVTGAILGETSTQLTSNLIDNGADIDAFEFDKTKIAVNGALGLVGAPLGVVVKGLSKPLQTGTSALLTPLEQEVIPELAIAPVKLVSGAALDEINKN